MKTLISRLKAEGFCHLIDNELLILSANQNTNELELETIHLKTKQEERFCLTIEEASEALLLPNNNFLVKIEEKNRVISSKRLDKLQKILKNPNLSLKTLIQ